MTDYPLTIRVTDALGNVAVLPQFTLSVLALPSYALAANITQNEGNAGTTNFTFTVNRSGDVSQVGAVNWSVAGTGANPAAASDFVGGVFPSGTVNFLAGQTSRTFNVPVAGDALTEQNETFLVSLSDVQGGGAISQATRVGTITNDDVDSQGLIAGANTIANITTKAGGTFANVVNGVTDVPIYTDGWVMRVDLDAGWSSIDPTKMVVNLKRPGFNADKTLDSVKWSDTCRGTVELRKPHPNSGDVLSPGANSFYIALDNPIFNADTIENITFEAGFYIAGGNPSAQIVKTASIGRFDTIPYPKPHGECLETPYTTRVSTANGSFTAEFGGFYAYGRGKPYAVVEGYARNVDTGTNGPAATQANMTLSAKTPNGNPSKMRGASYAVNIDTTGLADGACEIRWRLYPTVGNVIWDSALDGKAFPTIDPARGIPFIKDTAGKYSPIYAFVNYDGTGLLGTDDTGIQLNANDPAGAADTHASSYRSLAAAQQAAAVWNNKAGNRGANVHNTCAGLEIIIRETSISTTLGTDAGTYSLVRANNVAPAGPLAVTIRSKSGAAGLGARLRSVNHDGTGTGSNGNSRQWSSAKMKLKNIMIDLTGTANTWDGVAVDMANGQADDTLVDRHLILEDVVTKGRTFAAGGSTFYRAGFVYEIRHDQEGGASPNSAARADHQALTLGCRYTIGEGNTVARLVPRIAMGVWLVGGDVNDTNVYGANRKQADAALMLNVRVDYTTAGTSGRAVSFSQPYKYLNFANVLIRKYGTANTDTNLFLYGDGQVFIPDIVGSAYISVDGGDHGRSRENIDYMDALMGGAAKQRIIEQRYSALGGYNTKDDVHNVANTYSKVAGQAIAANMWYYPGSYVHDGNATDALKQFYRCKTTYKSAAATPVNDLADAAKWEPLGQMADVAIAEHPFRTQNWRGQHMVGRHNNVIWQSAQGAPLSTTPGGPVTWLGEVAQRGSLYNRSVVNYYVDPSGAGLGASLTDFGNYTPKPDGLLIPPGSGGSGIGVPSGFSPYPFDLYGNARYNDGSGAIGAIERGNVSVH